MKKILIFLLLLPLINADINLYPDYFDIEIYEKENQTHYFYIENTNFYDLYNISFSNIEGVHFNNISKIARANISQITNASNHTINYTKTTFYNQTFWIQTNTTFDNEYLSIMSYLYLDYRKEENKQHEVIVNSTGFYPNIIQIYQNDTIRFTNTDTNNHTVTSIYFDYSLNQDQSIILNFTDIELISYYDKITSIAGKINISNSTQLTYLHNPEYDEQITLNIHSKHIRADIDFQIFLTDISMEYNEIYKNVLNIRNNGEKAYNVALKGKWLEFEDNNIDIEANDYKIIYFNIKPENITQKDQTARDYFLNITMTGDNFDNITHDLNIYIKENNFTISIVDAQNITHYFITTPEYLTQICEKYPEYCPQINNTVEVYREKEQNFTVKGEDLQRIKDIVDKWAKEETESTSLYEEQIRSIQGEMQDTRSEINDQITGLNNIVNSMGTNIQLLNTTIGKSILFIDKVYQQQKEVSYTVIFFLIFLLGSLFSYGFYKYYIKRKGQFNEWY